MKRCGGSFVVHQTSDEVSGLNPASYNDPDVLQDRNNVFFQNLRGERENTEANKIFKPKTDAHFIELWSC